MSNNEGWASVVSSIARKRLEWARAITLGGRIGFNELFSLSGRVTVVNHALRRPHAERTDGRPQTRQTYRIYGTPKQRSISKDPTISDDRPQSGLRRIPSIWRAITEVRARRGNKCSVDMSICLAHYVDQVVAKASRKQGCRVNRFAN